MLLEGSNASTVLTWVRPDLDKHLNQIRTQIEHIAGSKVLGDGISQTAENLTQLKLTFQTLVMQGASLLVDEMITLCDRLQNGHVRNPDQAFAALMDAIVVVPSYLDRLQAGHHDLPIILLPVINELRAAYNANVVSEATLFTPNLNIDIPELEGDPEHSGKEFDEPAPAFIQLMLRQYEGSLLHWLQNQEEMTLMEPIHSVCKTLANHLEGEQVRRLWWIASVVVSGLLEGVTENDVHLRRLFARLHLNIKTLAEKGEETLDLSVVDSVSQALLFHIAQAKQGCVAVDSLRKRFNLYELVPDRDALIRARGAVSGRNRELYLSLGAAVRDEMSLIKNALDLELRTGEVEPERRQKSHHALLRLKDTLAMMGLGDTAQSIEALMPAFEASGQVREEGQEGSDDGLNGTSNAELLMALAEKLLQVESVLDEQIATLGEPLLTDQDSGFIELPVHEQLQIRAHLLDEAVTSLHHIQEGVRRHFDGFADADYLSGLEHVAGALEIIGETETAQLAQKLRNALDNMLRVTKLESQIDPDKLEKVTDAVAAFELYLAACRDQQSNRSRFLIIIKDRLEHLPIGEMEVVSSPERAEATEPEPTVVEASGKPDLLDNELLGVFLEEYETVVAMLGEQIPQWIEHKENAGAMSDIRRGFHTLKGSGRMVGAYELGDFAWHIEELVNDMLDNNIEDFDAVETILKLANAALPAMKQRLLGKPALLGTEGINAIAAVADALCASKTANWASFYRVLPAAMLEMVPGSEMFDALSEGRPEAAELSPEAQAISDDETLNELIRAEFSSNLGTLKALMDDISRNRSTVAQEAHIIAAHTIAGTASLKPLSRESDVAKALEGLLGAQSDSEKVFSDTAMWLIATTIAHLSICLAIHLGDEDAELIEDEASLITQLVGLTVEYEKTRKHAEEPQGDQAGKQGSALSDAEEDADTGELTADSGDTDKVDREILALFLQEASDILAECDSLLNSWRDNVPELKIVQILQREIHTFKGGARMSGVSSMGDLSHAMETLLEQIAGKILPPTVEAIEALEQGCDHLTGWVEDAGRGQIPGIGNALEQFEQRAAALLSGPEQAETDIEPELEAASEHAHTTEAELEAEAEAEAEAATATDTTEQAVEVRKEPSQEQASVQQPESEEAEREATELASEVVELEESAEIPVELPDIPAEETTVLENNDEGAGSQQIRVNADLLDSLINSAGEISIFRSRLEQQVGQQRETLKEFDETVSRLREQFRKLEIETETQIRSRYQQESSDGSEEFDPLELDRFSSMQQLSRSLSESVSDLLNLQELLDESARKSEALLVQQSRVSTELQEGLMQTRMVHFATIAPRLRRVVRAAASDTGKKALLHLRMTGGGDQIDRNVLERITAPLEHLLRNAIAHGIETPKQRRKLGKPADGDISVTVASKATEFVVRVQDDGGGLDHDAIKQRAIETGLIDENADQPVQQLLQFILQSGFSTSKTVTGLSGRGVGMDVVNSEIKQIGGSIDIDSQPGKGTLFTIRIPFTLAVMQAIGVSAGEHRYLIPLASVAGVARMLPANYQKLHETETPVYEFAGDEFRVLELEPLLGEPSTPLGDDTVSILLIKAGEQRAAFRVPELLGHREIVIKPVGPQISSVPGILGGTITADGQVVIIIDSGPLIRKALMTGAQPAPPLLSRSTGPKQLLAMVVDDSITMRKVTSRVLESHDFEVITARDGVDATELMQDRVPDLLLLDVEMPRMDGYQVAEYVRADARLRHVPIIMITSRAGDKHRERGRRAGADGYISKPYKEVDLLDEVKQLLRSKRKEEANQNGSR